MALAGSRHGAGAKQAAPRRRPCRRQAGFAGLACGGQGNPDDEKRRGDVRERRSHLVEQTKNALVQQNLNYQKDLDEVALIVAKTSPAAKRKSARAWRRIYANEFSEQELKDLVTFYKSPLGQKLLTSEPRAIQLSMTYMNQWAQEFADMSTANSAAR